MGLGGQIPRRLAYSDLAWSAQYRSLHGRAHRKPPPRVGAPALTRHVTLWIPPEDRKRPYSKSEFQARRNRWVADIDWFLASFILNAYERWREGNGPAHLIPTSFNASPNGTSFRFHFFHYFAAYDTAAPELGVKFKRMSHALTAEEAEAAADRDDADEPSLYDDEPVDHDDDGVHDADSRFETVSFRVFYEDVPVKVRAELHTEYVTLSFTADLDVAGDALFDARTSDVCKKLTKDFETIARIAQGRWDSSAERCARAKSNQRLDNDTHDLDGVARHLFHWFWRDFDRAYVAPALSPTIAEPSDAKQGRGAFPPLKERLGERILDIRGVVLAADEPSAGCASLGRVFGVTERGAEQFAAEPIKPSDQLKMLDAILPLVEGSRRALSAQSRTPRGTRWPYFHYEYAASSMQGGRAVFISPLAPQRMRSGLNSPGSYIVIVNHKSRWEIGRLVDRLHSVASLRVASLWGHAAINKAGYRLRQILTDVDRDPKLTRGAVNALNKRFRAASKAVPEGGLQYRTERCLFYVDRFYEEAKSLRAERIEGYQPYRAFVERRLGEWWAFVRRLQSRHERVSRSLELLNSEIRAREELEQTGKLRELLQFAELTAVVPVSYYGGHILKEVITGETPWGWEVVMPAWFGSGHGEAYLGFYMMASGLAYGLIWLVLKLREELGARR